MKNLSYDKKMFRLMRILYQLNASGRVRTVDLSREFAVTKRTVQRDLNLLMEAGFPLVLQGTEHSFVKGFSFRKNMFTK